MAQLKKQPPKTVPEFLERIYLLQRSAGVSCYRGEANATWKLKPSVMRDLRAEAEQSIIRELLLDAPSEFRSDSSMFEKLVRAQHYGLPTRLLDASLNPLVALFFACYEKEHKGEDGKVIVMTFPQTRVKYAESDTVSILCNVAKLTDAERKTIDESVSVLMERKFADKDLTDALMKSDEIGRLLHFVRSEKPYFKDRIDFTDFRKYYFVYPSKNNKRLVAQAGAFVVAGLLKYQKVENAKSFKSQIITIPAKEKVEILKQLDQININHRALFPEIEFASRYIKEKWSKSTDAEASVLLGDIFG